MAFDHSTFDAGQTASTALQHGGETVQHLALTGQSQMTLPEGFALNSAQYVRDGMDLVLHADSGDSLVLDAYFAQAEAPVLQDDSGLSMTPKLVNSFVTNGHDYASTSLMSDVSPIGLVEELSGKGTVTHPDGSVEPLTLGTPIYQGDIVETGDHGAVNIVFVDESRFAVSEDARLSIDEFVFDPASEGGQTDFSVLKGLFVYTSGLIGREDPDDVHIDTPVGSIGIRGTIIAGNVDNGEITVVEGAIVLRDFGGNEVTLADQFATARFSTDGQGIEPMGQLSPADVAGRFAGVSDVAPDLFSSVNDAAGENQGGNNDAGQGAAEAEAAEGNQEPADAAADEASNETTTDAQSDEQTGQDTEAEADEAADDEAEAGSDDQGAEAAADDNSGAEGNDASQSDGGDAAAATSDTTSADDGASQSKAAAAQAKLAAKAAAKAEAQADDSGGSDSASDDSSSTDSDSSGTSDVATTDSGNETVLTTTTSTTSNTADTLLSSTISLVSSTKSNASSNASSKSNNGKSSSAAKGKSNALTQIDLVTTIDSDTSSDSDTSDDTDETSNAPYIRAAKFLPQEDFFTFIPKQAGVSDPNSTFTFYFDQIFGDDGGKNNLTYSLSDETIKLLNSFIQDASNTKNNILDDLDSDGNALPGWEFDASTGKLTLYINEDDDNYTPVDLDFDVTVIATDADGNSTSYTVEYTVLAADDLTAFQNPSNGVYQLSDQADVYYTEFSNGTGYATANTLHIKGVSGTAVQANIFTEDVGQSVNNFSEMLQGLFNGSYNSPIAYLDTVTNANFYMGDGDQIALIKETTLGVNLYGGNDPDDYNGFIVQNADNNIYGMDGDDIVYIDYEYAVETLSNTYKTTIDGGHNNSSNAAKIVNGNNYDVSQEDFGDVLHFAGTPAALEVLDFSAFNTNFTNFETLSLSDGVKAVLNVDDVIAMTDLQNVLTITSYDNAGNSVDLDGFTIKDVNGDGKITDADAYSLTTDGAAECYYTYEGTGSDGQTVTLLVEENLISNQVA